MLQAMAKDVAFPGGLGSRGDVAVQPCRRNFRAALIEARARLHLEAVVALGAFPGSMGAGAFVAA